MDGCVAEIRWTEGSAGAAASGPRTFQILLEPQLEEPLAEIQSEPELSSSGCVKDTTRTFSRFCPKYNTFRYPFYARLG